MLTWEKIKQPQLDIVGIVAVLGEGSTARNAQASAAGWHHLLPRLLPAPQALLKHEHEKRLPTVPGTVVGAYSGNVKFELNFFCQLLHEDNLDKNEVELVEVTARSDVERNTPYLRLKKWYQERQRKKEEKCIQRGNQGKHPHHLPRAHKRRETAYDVKALSPLALLSILGCFMSVGLFIGSHILKDGFACMATLLLSLTSSIVGFASRWRLDFKEDPPKDSDVRKSREKAIPDSDVIIYYPRQGAFRVIRCSEQISRLYFRTEVCEYSFDENWHRILALFSSICLMAGLLCLSNSNTPMQIAFAASYIALNALHWGVSALNPTRKWGHWKHKYDCKKLPFEYSFISGKFPAPVRSETGQSANQSRPVFTSEPLNMTQDSLTSSGAGGQIMNGSAFASPKPSLQVVTSNTSVPENVDKKSRKVAFQANGAPASVMVLKDSNAAPMASPTDLKSYGTTTALDSPVQLSAMTPEDRKRFMTFDAEGFKVRLRKPFGSAQDAISKLFSSDSSKPEMHQPGNKPQGATPSTSTDSRPEEDRKTFTTALWKTIALTGTSRWLNQTHIAPDNEVWKAWVTYAGKRAEPYENKDTNQLIAAATLAKDGVTIQLPSWNCEAKLNELFEEAKDKDKRRPPKPKTLADVVMQHRLYLGTVRGISPVMEKRLLRVARKSRQKKDETRVQRSNTLPSPVRAQPNTVARPTRPSPVNTRDFGDDTGGS